MRGGRAVSLIIALAFTCNESVALKDVDIIGETSVYLTAETITGAPTPETARLLQAIRQGRDFHIVVMNLPTDRMLNLELGFAEIVHYGAGQRIFDLYVNDKQALSQFDISAVAGGPHRAVVRPFTITPRRGFLDFHFIGVTGEACVSYLRIFGTGVDKNIYTPADPASALSPDPEGASSRMGSYSPGSGEILQDVTNQTWPSGVPFGGIGTGKFEILPNGEFSNFTVNNSWDLPVMRPPGTFIAVATKSASGGGSARLLKVRSAADSLSHYATAKGFTSVAYKGLFPFAEWLFKDDKIPVETRLDGWSPLLPGNEKDSSIPTAILSVSLYNPRPYPVSVGVTLSWEDLNGRGGSRNRGDQFGYFGPSVHSDAATSGVKGVHIRSNVPADGRRSTFVGDYFIGTPIKGAVVTRALYWNPHSAEIPWWKSFSTRIRLEKIPAQPASVIPAPNTRGASQGAAAVCATINLGSKERRRVPFIISWYMPGVSTLPAGATTATIENQDYATSFASSLGVASYVASNRARLYDGTSEWHSMVLRSNLPVWLKTHMLNSLFPLVSNSVLLSGGRFSMLEAPGEMGGMMGGVDWRLASSSFLRTMFPRLDGTELDFYAKAQTPEGRIPRFIGNIHGGWSGLEPGLLGDKWADPTNAWMLQTAALYRETGDETFLARVAPHLERALAFIEKADMDGDHVPDGGCILDPSSTAPAAHSYSALNYAGALRVASSVLGRTISAEKKRSVVQSVSQVSAQVDAGMKKGDGSTFAATLAAQWALVSMGLPPLLDDVATSAALTSLLSRHVTPHSLVIPMEVQKSLGTSVVSQSYPGVLQSYLGAAAILAGMADEGLEVFERMHTIAYRASRNPWSQAVSYNTPNASKPRLRSHVSSMASWSALAAISGATFVVPQRTLFLDPHIPSKMQGELTVPIFTHAFWAWLDYNEQDSTGTLAITKVMPGYEGMAVERIARRTLSDGTLQAEQRLAQPLLLKEGEVLELKGWPKRIDGTVAIQTPVPPVPVDQGTTGTLSDDMLTSFADYLTTDTGQTTATYGP